MNTVAFYSGNTVIYWSSVIIALGTVGCIALTLALYTARGGKAFSVFVLTPVAICLSVLLARLLHWYCHTEQYESFASAMTSFSSGNYCMPGVLIGSLIAVLLLKKTGTIKSVAFLLDCLVPGFTVLTVFIRLSAFFNSTCRSKFTVKNPVFQRFPIAVPASDSAGIAEWRFATFFWEAAVLTAAAGFLLWFYFNRRGTPMKNGLPKRGNTALMFLLLFSAVELVSDSTRYDASFARFNGFISVTQMFSAVSALIVLIIFSVRSVRANGFIAKHALLWILFLVLLAATGFCEYLVQRHGDWYVIMYAAMTAAVLLMVVSVWMMYKTLPKRSSEEAHNEQ